MEVEGVNVDINIPGSVASMVFFGWKLQIVCNIVDARDCRVLVEPGHFWQELSTMTFSAKMQRYGAYISQNGQALASVLAALMSSGDREPLI